MSLQYQKYQVKKEVKLRLIAEIDPSQLLLLKFTRAEEKTQLTWEHAKEFEYKGEMYDVVNSKTEGDTSFYWVWHDHQETEINRQLNTLVSKSLDCNQQHNESQKRLSDFFKIVYLPTTFSQAADRLLISHNSNYAGQHTYFSVTAQPPLLPPEMIS